MKSPNLNTPTIREPMKTTQATPASIEEFLKHYITCSLWSSMDESDENGGDPMDRNYNESDLAPNTRAQMMADCMAFMHQNAQDIATCTKGDSQTAHDFWLSRNGHGAGFFDAYRGDPYPDDVAKRLQEAARAFGECNLYVGDDGMIYF